VHARLKRTGHFWQGRFGCVAMDEAMSRRLSQAETIGRPLGADAFVARLDAESGCTLRAGKRGPRRRG
jgi:hypothetical protein